MILPACSQKACIKCCSDLKCEGHREHREKESIINGTHPINKLAQQKRLLAIKPGAFRDPAFQYLGETIIIWSLREYMSNVKWREDAIRKSLRNLESRKQGIFVESHSQLRKRQKRRGFDDVHNSIDSSGVDCERSEDDESNQRPSIVSGSKRMNKECRRKRFCRIMNELYEKSQTKG